MLILLCVLWKLLLVGLKPWRIPNLIYNSFCFLDNIELLEQKLEEQKEQLTSEFAVERTSHQKMIGEYARLEQRFDNLQQELQIEKSSPDKRRSQYDSGKI